MLRRSALSPRRASVRRLIEDVWAVAVALAVLLAGIARPDVRTTPAVDDDAETNKALVRRYFAIAGQGDLRTLREVVSADLVVRTAPPGEGTPPQRLTQTLAQAHAGLTDVTVRIDDLFATVDLVVARTTISGAHIGNFFDAPPTGERIVIPAIDVWRVAGGKLAEVWHFADTVGLRQHSALTGFGTGQALPAVATDKQEVIDAATHICR